MPTQTSTETNRKFTRTQESIHTDQIAETRDFFNSKIFEKVFLGSVTSFYIFTVLVCSARAFPWGPLHISVVRDLF